MSLGSDQSGVEELSLRLGDLSISIRRASAPTERGSPGRESQGSLAGPRAPESDLGSFSRVSSVAGTASPTESALWRADILSAETLAELETQDLTVIEHLLPRIAARHLRSGLSARARLGRALQSGVAARTVLSGSRTVPRRSIAVNLPNAIFVILRAAPGHQEPFWTDSATVYFRAVQVSPGVFHSRSLSHAFATRTEAEAYCIGAGVAWPPALQWVELCGRRR